MTSSATIFYGDSIWQIKRQKAVYVACDKPFWVAPVTERLEHLVELDEGWDSHGAKKVDAKLAEAALGVLNYLMTDGVPIPSIVPTINGGVQFEWHALDKHLEVEIVSPALSLVYYEDEDESKEFEVRYDLEELRAIIDHELVVQV